MTPDLMWKLERVRVFLTSLPHPDTDRLCVVVHMRDEFDFVYYGIYKNKGGGHGRVSVKLVEFRAGHNFVTGDDEEILNTPNNTQIHNLNEGERLRTRRRGGCFGIPAVKKRVEHNNDT
jgi:hypothetical protein